MNMVVDDELMPDCDNLKTFFEEEVKELAESYNISARGEDMFISTTHEGAVLSAVE